MPYNVNEILSITYWYSKDNEDVRPRITCSDGFSISIQASRHHYCLPREDMQSGYTHIECGYPNKYEELLDKYAEDPGTTSTVFPYVPVSLVDEVIEKHGGLTKIGDYDYRGW